MDNVRQSQKRWCHFVFQHIFVVSFIIMVSVAIIIIMQPWQNPKPCVCVWATNNIYSIQRYTIILSFRTTNVEQEECFVHKVLCLSLYQKALLLFPSLQKPPHHCWSLCCLSPTKQKVDLTHLCSSFKLVIEHFQWVFANPKVASDRSSLAWIFRWIWVLLEFCIISWWMGKIFALLFYKFALQKP